MRCRKGQIQYVFAFILFIIIAGFLAMTGYKAITSASSGTCDLDKTRFGKEVVGYLESYNRYGSVHVERLGLPCGYDTVCFVNGEGLEGWSAPNAVLATARDSQNNVFIGKEGFMEPVGYSKKVQVESDAKHLCLTGTSVEILFRGAGQKTNVTGD